MHTCMYVCMYACEKGRSLILGCILLMLVAVVMSHVAYGEDDIKCLGDGCPCVVHVAKDKQVHQCRLSQIIASSLSWVM